MSIFGMRMAAPVIQPLERQAIQAFSKAFSAASDAQTAKGRGDDAMRVMNGSISPSQFMYNTGIDLMGGVVGGGAGRLFSGPATSNFASTFTGLGFSYMTSGK